MSDHEYMERALALARRGAGRVSPNPLVGAVVVREQRVVGEAFHDYAGTKHAEVLACEQAGRAAEGATLYLNLEPCSHHGRTPPCSDYLIQAGIRRVVAAMEDPNPAVRGRGFERLRQAGVAVETGLLRAEAESLNEGFTKWITSGLPFVTLKSAMSLDGKIANDPPGRREFLSGPESAERTQALRLQADAIVVGSGTVLADDPLLTYRGGEKRRRPLVRILLDVSGRVSLQRRLFLEPEPVWWVVSRLPANAPAHVVHVPPAAEPSATWHEVLKRMAGEGMHHLLIEGGAETSASALRSDIVDKLCFVYAPKLIGGAAVSAVGGSSFNPPLLVRSLRCRESGEDCWLEGYLH